MRVVLTTSGSFGDLHPYLAIARGLKSRGHEVTVATAEPFRPYVEAEGVQFALLRGAICSLNAPAGNIERTFNPRTGVRFLIEQRLAPHAEDIYRDLLAICEGKDLLVSHAGIVGAPLVAEKLGIHWLSGVLSPISFLSAYDPPVLSMAPWLNHLRTLAPLPYWALRIRKRASGGKLIPLIADLRRREGLGPGSGSVLYRDMFSPSGTLALFSPVLAPAQRDWPAHTCVTGFCWVDNSIPGIEAMTPELRAFLAAGDAPVAFTLGSVDVVRAGDFYQQSVAAVAKLGCRAVLLAGGHAEEYQALRSQNIFVASYVPYAEIFSGAAAVVHQGGMGTVGLVLRAGVPSLVAPAGWDQFDNAQRLQRLGMARVLPRSLYNAERLAGHLQKLLTRTSYRQAAQRYGETARHEDGVANACIAIEQICAGRSL